MSTRAALIFLVLASADVSAQIWVASNGGEWEPDEPVLEGAMSKLGESFSEASSQRSGAVPQWASYKLRYRAYVENGVRLLGITGTCDKYDPPELDGEELVLIADGGPCHFDAIYDPAEGKVLYFFLHGYA